MQRAGAERGIASRGVEADIARIIDEVKGRAPTAANDLLRFAHRIFAFGVRRRMVPANPASGFSPRLDGGGTERARSRALSVGELAQLFEKVRETPSFGAANALALKLLLALCVRKGELLCRARLFSSGEPCIHARQLRGSQNH